jgi:hypothetical protein
MRNSANELMTCDLDHKHSINRISSVQFYQPEIRAYTKALKEHPHETEKFSRPLGFRYIQFLLYIQLLFISLTAMRRDCQENILT